MGAGVPDLHVLTDATVQDRYDHAALAGLAARGGATAVQFREKRTWTTRELIATARRMRGAVGGRARVIVDDRADVALAAGADGVHLGRHDLPPAVARRILGPEALVGGTANSLVEAVAAAAAPVDYLGVGPVYGTRSKAAPAPALGPEGLAAIVRAVAKPVVAIGNITPPRVPEVLDAGAAGVAVLAAVVTAPDPEEATRRFREAIDGWRRQKGADG